MPLQGTGTSKASSVRERLDRNKHHFYSDTLFVMCHRSILQMDFASNYPNANSFLRFPEATFASLWSDMTVAKDARDINRITTKVPPVKANKDVRKSYHSLPSYLIHIEKGSIS
mmetsp:Transcript_39781/g.59512  ORF Transcript_39781/g.59512 Transcript_39781/m.59512 type:complete len:114 (+) Transcript_39781:65-406(+)